MLDAVFVTEILPMFKVAGAPTVLGNTGITAIVIVDPLADNLTVSIFNELGPKYKSAKGFASVPKLTVLVVGITLSPTNTFPPMYILLPIPTPPVTINAAD